MGSGWANRRREAGRLHAQSLPRCAGCHSLLFIESHGVEDGAGGITLYCTECYERRYRELKRCGERFES
jgi:hypothetical protein